MRREENQSTGEKPLGARTRTNNKPRYFDCFSKMEKETYFFRFSARNVQVQVQVQVCLFHLLQNRQNKSKKDIYYGESGEEALGLIE